MLKNIKFQNIYCQKFFFICTIRMYMHTYVYEIDSSHIHSSLYWKKKIKKKKINSFHNEKQRVYNHDKCISFFFFALQSFITKIFIVFLLTGSVVVLSIYKEHSTQARLAKKKCFFLS